MNITNTTSGTDPYAATAGPSGFRQQFQDFKSLGASLQSGDLNAAQSALTKVANDIKGNQANGKSSPLLDPNTTAGKDFKALQDALKSGDVKSAQDAFATLKKDLRAAGGAHGHHHHARVDNDGDNDGSGGATGSSTATSPLSGTGPNQVLNVTA
jgi:hypothetical protein